MGQNDYEALLHMLWRWAQEDHLKKFKLVITSRPEDHITQTFPESISIHVNIPSGSSVKPGDSVSNDICAFPKKQLKDTYGRYIGWWGSWLSGFWCCWYVYLGNNHCKIPQKKSQLMFFMGEVWVLC